MNDCRIRPEALDAYFHGMLNEAQHREMSAHLLTCPSCNKTLSALEAETYLIGKGLRNVEVPAMGLSAAELVARYAGTRAPDATTIEVPAQQDESNKTLQPAQALEVVKPAGKAPRLNLVRWFASSSAGRRNTLATAAAIALVCGAAVWFAASIMRRLDDLGSQQMALADAQKHFKGDQETWNREETDRTFNREAAQQKWKDNVITPMQKQLTDAVALLQEQDKDRTAIADLHRELAELKAAIEKHKADESRIAAIELELQQKQESARLNEEKVRKIILSIKDLNQQQEFIPEPDALALIPAKDDPVTWEEIKNTPSVNALKTRNGIIGWGVSLSQFRLPGDDASRGGPQAVALGPGDVRYNAPAVKDGRIFAGTGWNENVLAAIDSSTGQLKWTYAAHDGGVGAPTLSDDGRTVYFTTAGGSLHSVTVNGKRNWTCKLGETVLAQPAINQHFIYVVHSTRNSPPGFGDKKFPYSITCLHDGIEGNVVWTKGLSADAVTSPVIDSGGRVYIATRDGQISIFDGKGTNLSSYSASATSAPVIAGNNMYFSTWESTSDTGFEESISRLGSDIKGAEHLAGPFPAAYLLPNAATPGAISFVDQRKAEQIAAQQAVAPQFRHAWSCLGARPTIIDQTAFAAVGDHLVSFDLRRGKVNWSKKIVGQTEAAGSAVQNGQGQPSLTPPSYANGRLYLGSMWGDMLCVNAENGEIVWRYRLPDAQPVTSQVMLDQGMAYATTAKGTLICINTQDALATGWNMWGGSSSHNGPAATPSARFHPGAH